MRIFNPIHKCIVTAVSFTVLFCSSLVAQEATIDELFDDLLQAPVEKSERIADRIHKIWSKSGSASMDLLLKRGRDALDNKDTAAAIDHFSALIDHAPDFAEAYNMRASAYFAAGYYGPALADLRIAISLSPRHFRAMTGLGMLQEAMEQPEKALETYRKVLELMPHNQQVLSAVSRLEGVAL